jgi:hypothetical protein
MVVLLGSAVGPERAVGRAEGLQKRCSMPSVDSVVDAKRLQA